MVEPPPPAPSPQDHEVPLARPVRAFPYAPLPPPDPSPLELGPVSRRDALLDLGLVGLTALLVPMGFMVILALLTEDLSLDPAAIPLMVIQKWFDVLLASGLLAYLALRHRLSPACFGLSPRGAGRQALWTCGTLLATYGWMMVTLVMVFSVLLLFPALQEDLMKRTELLELLPVDSFLWTVLLLVPVAIHEEILFRALLLPFLRRLIGRWWAAVVISSLVFALLHFDQGVMGMLQILGVGTVFAVFFVWSRSLIAVIVAHFLFNFMQFQLIRFLL